MKDFTHLQQDMPLALRFAVSRRLLLEFDGDSPSSQTDGGVRTTGTGDSQLGIQVVLQHEKESRLDFRSLITSSFQRQIAPRA